MFCSILRFKFCNSENTSDNNGNSKTCFALEISK